MRGRRGYRRLLPVWWEDDPAVDLFGDSRRTARDWVVDTMLFFSPLAVDALAVAGVLYSSPPAPRDWLLVDVIVGIAAASALWLRRRWPIGVAIALLPLVVLSPMARLPATITGFNLCVHRRLSVALAVGAGTLAATAANLVIREGVLEPLPSLVLSVLVGSAVLLSGQFVRARRLLVLSLRDRADRVETELHLRISQARQLEQTRIAREMHDVLAHRMTLLSMHAGALAFRPDASPGEIAHAAEVIRDSAHQALTDLRVVIGVLREVDPVPEPTSPQPAFEDVPALFDEARAAGHQIDVDNRVDIDIPAGVGRTAYRIVQEALTNAGKHAAHQPVRIRLCTDVDALTIEISNRLGGRPADVPGAGVGLIGMSERVALSGGELEYGPVGGATFKLRARLPFRA